LLFGHVLPLYPGAVAAIRFSRTECVYKTDHPYVFPHPQVVTFAFPAIIHCGIGIIAATSKAKIPQIIISIFADHPL
jgi:hypothetical protein